MFVEHFIMYIGDFIYNINKYINIIHKQESVEIIDKTYLDIN